MERDGQRDVHLEVVCDGYAGWIEGIAGPSALRHIGALYAVEATERGKPPEVRLAARRAHSGPTLPL